MGSKGLSGLADSTIVMKKIGGAESRQRRLSFDNRESCPPLWKIELDPITFRYKSIIKDIEEQLDIKNVKVTENNTKDYDTILNVIPFNNSDASPISRKQIETETGLNKSIVQKEMKRMEQEGDIYIETTGSGSVPSTYYRQIKQENIMENDNG